MQVFGHKGVQVKSLAYGINDVPISSNAAFNPLSVLIFSRNRLRSRLTALSNEDDWTSARRRTRCSDSALGNARSDQGRPRGRFGREKYHVGDFPAR